MDLDLDLDLDVCEYFSSFCESEFAFEMHTTMGKKVFQFFKRWLTLESVGSKRRDGKKEKRGVCFCVF